MARKYGEGVLERCTSLDVYLGRHCPTDSPILRILTGENVERTLEAFVAQLLRRCESVRPECRLAHSLRVSRHDSGRDSR
jgi:hypothetical protein